MTNRKASYSSYSEKETVRRADAALKRMFSTPHKPHKPIGKKKKDVRPDRHKKGR
jgi:hypothetical protein